MRVARGALGLAAVVTIVVQVRPAEAAFHLMVVEEAFFGTEDCPNAQYVMLQMTFAGQTLVQNKAVSTFDATGTAAPDFGSFDHNVSNGALGARILMGTAEAQALFGIKFDNVVSGRLPLPDGQLCWAGTFDCLAYGAFTGANPGGGSPAQMPVLGMALARRADTKMDINDFVVAPPMPENNAGQIGHLGQCPGSAATATPTEPTATATPPGPSPTPTTTATAKATLPADAYICPGDCNRDRKVAINEVVTSLNVELDNGSADACQDTDVNRNGRIEIDELLAAVDDALNGCPPLGTRRFSLNPNTSPFTAALQFGPFQTLPGFEGFLELRASVPGVEGVPFGGLAFIDIIDSSDYISVFVPPQGGTAGVALCLRPRKDLFPIINAGLIDCDGGSEIGAGLMTSQDHNIGVVGQCSGGDHAGSDCAMEGDCPNGHCFTAADCTAAHGVVEAAPLPHPGVCNGPLMGSQLAGDAAPGYVVIAQDPVNMTIKGLPAVLSMEEALPCGDESVPAMETAFAFTTGVSRATIEHVDNGSDSFAQQLTGESFSCRDWSRENGRGTLVLAVPTLDLNLGSQYTDFVSEFTLDD